MKPLLFRDLPEIAELEQEYRLYLDNRLVKPEREDLERRLEEKSIELFGITEQDTHYSYLPSHEGVGTVEEWETHFDFLEWEHEEENVFWEFFGIDVSDEDGVQLACMDVFGRQLVCALKRLQPRATLTFRQDEQTDEQHEAAAEAWAERLLRRT